VVPQHAARLVAPWYAPDGNAGLHQYLDDEFIARFRDDLSNGRLNLEERTAWRRRDFFGGYKDHVSLRQAVHGAFNLVSAEVVCDHLGAPAFDAQRIRSGCVAVRRRIDAVAHGWLVADGTALGWRPVDERLDPRTPRVSPRDGGVLAVEESAPLHTLSARDGAGRRRTVMFGYLPIGGGVVRRQQPGRPLQVRPGLEPLRSGILQELPRPLGSGVGPGARAAGATLLVDRGRVSTAFLTLLQILVERHRVGLEETDAERANTSALRNVLARWRFDLPLADQDGGDVPGEKRRLTERNVLDWLSAELAPRRLPANTATPELDPEYRPLLGALGEARKAADVLPVLPEWSSVTLPDGGGSLSLNLHADPALARELAETVAARTVSMVTALAREIPIPRFAFGDDDVYHAATFVTWAGKACEHTVAGPNTAEFRVAPPYSGEAARPTAIQLPSLKDLRRGLPTHGFVAPADLAKKLLGVRGKFPDLELGDAASFNLCWWFAFSIPSITICAFILLFIILIILNLLFWWLPWVFLKFPFFCKRD
jgi:hypothetical protein